MSDTPNTKKTKARKEPFYKKILRNGLSASEIENLIYQKLWNDTTGLTCLPQDVTLGEIVKRKEETRQLVKKLTGPERQPYLKMLAGTQMVAAHNGAMYCLRIAMNGSPTSDVAARYFGSAAKLMGIFARLEELTGDRPEKGRQEIKVQYQHVNVQSGGQAAVANFGDGRPAELKQKKPEVRELPHSAEKSFTIDGSPKEPVAEPVKRKQDDA